MERIVYTRHDGGVSICTPSPRCLAIMEVGGLWKGMPRGFIDEQIERQIAAGHKPYAARKFAHALAYGGCTHSEALEIIRDRDCGHLGTAHELISPEDIPDIWFRNAWRRSHNGGPIYIDMREARDIQLKRVETELLRENKRRDEARQLGHGTRELILNRGYLLDRLRAAEKPADLMHISLFKDSAMATAHS